MERTVIDDELKEELKKGCCFSGHRVLDPKKLPLIERLVENEITWMISHGVESFTSGAAIGFDLLAGRAVLRAREHNPNVKLNLIIPCGNQDIRYSKTDKAEYHRQIAEADRVVVLSSGYYNGCMQIRDRFLVEHSSYCICWLERTTGGTAYTVKYARSRGLPVVNLAERDIADETSDEDYVFRSSVLTDDDELFI